MGLERRRSHRDRPSRPDIAARLILYRNAFFPLAVAATKPRLILIIPTLGQLRRPQEETVKNI